MGESSWWASQGKTIGTTLSLMGPSFAIGAAVSAATVNPALGAAAAAMFSRKAESAMEANGAFQEEYRKYIQEGKSEQEAKELAGKSAATIFKANAAMLPLDFMQFAVGLKAFAPLKALGTAAKATRAGKIGAIAFQPLSEAAEEGYQFIAQEEAIKGVREGITPFGEGLGERVSEYMKDPDFQESAFMGAVTGGIFGGISTVANKAKEKIEGYGVSKAIAANLGDIESFNKINNRIERDMLIRALKTNKLDQYKENLTGFVKDFSAKEDVDKIELENVKIRAKELSDNIDFIKSAKAQIIATNPDYANNKEVLAAYTMNKYADKKNTESLIKAESEISKLESEMTDPRDVLVKIDGQLFGLRNTREVISNDISLTAKIKEEKLKNLDERIAEKKAERKLALEELKTNSEFKGFKADEYTSPNKSAYNLAIFKKYQAEQNRTAIRAELAKYDKKSKEEIEKDDAKIIEDTKKKMIEQQVIAKTQELEKAATVAKTKQIIKDNEDKVTKTGLEKGLTDLSNKENPNYSIGDNIDANKIYGETGIDNKEATKSFIKDQAELSKKIAKEFKDLKVDEFENIANTIQSLKEANSLDEFNAVIEYINEASISNLEYADKFKRLKNTIDTFYKDKETAYNNRFKDADKNTTELTEHIERKTPTESITFEPIEHGATGAFDVTMQEFLYKEMGNNKWKAKTLKGRYENAINWVKRGLNWKELNSYKEFPVDTEVEYEVDFAADWAIGKKKKESGEDITWKNFQIEAVAKNSKGIKRVIGFLPVLDAENKEAENSDKLIALRKLIWDKSQGKSGIYQTGIKTKITISHAGRIRSSFDRYYSPSEIVKGTDVPVKLAIITSIDGNKTITGLSDEDMSNISSGFLSNASVGHVYQFLPAANGRLIPIRVFTKKIRDFNTEKDGIQKNEIKQRVFKKILNIFDFGTNLGEIAKDIKQDVYINFDVPDKKAFNGEGKLTIYKNKKGYDFNITKLKSKDAAELEKLSLFLDDLMLQVDAKRLNTVKKTLGKSIKYNESISDRLKVNVEPGNWIYGARYTLDSVYSELDKKDITPTEEAKKEGVLEEKGVEIKPEDVRSDIPTDFGEDTTTKEKPTEVKNEKEESLNYTSKKITKRSDKKHRGNSHAPKASEATEEKYTLWNKEKEIAWFKKNFPQISIEVLEGLLEISKHGGLKAWGLFKNAGIQLSSIAKEGTTYHEAFHVVFNLFLDNKTKDSLLKEIKKGRDITDLQAEEELADRFAEYQLSEKEFKTFSEKVNNFFSNLYDIIKYFITGNADIDLIFKRTSRGYYKNKPFKQDVSTITDIVRYSYQVKDLTFQETDARAINIANEMRLYLNEEYLKHNNISRKDFIKSFLNSKYELEKQDGSKYKVNGADLLLEEAYFSIVDIADEYQEKGLLNKYNHVNKQLGITIENIITLDENGQIPESSHKVERLGELALRKLALSEGINIKVNTTTYVGFDNKNSELFEINEDEIKKQGWENEVVENSKKESARSEVKSELSYMFD